jgi:hypothetical protein
MVRKILLALLLIAAVAVYFAWPNPDPPYEPPEPPKPLSEQEKLALLPLEELAQKDPVEFLQRCLTKYEKEVAGYTCIFNKQEKVKGKMRKKEEIKIHFREKPFSVRMAWIKGNGLLEAQRTLYLETEGYLVAVPTLNPFQQVDRMLNDPQVEATSRFPISEFGVYKGAKSTFDAMRAAKEKGTLHVKYEGKMAVKEVGGNECFKLVRTPYNPPEVDNINELTVYIDCKTLLQVGSVLKDPDGNLIAEYFFLDIKLNPTFDEDQFTRKKL